MARAFRLSPDADFILSKEELFIFLPKTGACLRFSRDIEPVFEFLRTATTSDTLAEAFQFSQSVSTDLTPASLIEILESHEALETGEPEIRNPSPIVNLPRIRFNGVESAKQYALLLTALASGM